jgi:two-component system, NtrC family, sensor kinase
MKATVLIVDDSLTVRMDLEDALAAAGLETILCGSATEGRHALASQPIDVVVLDVVLPDGDGVALLQEIRSDPATAQIPVLMLSNEGEVRDRIRGVSRGADDYAGKPYDRAYIVGRVQDWLRTRRRGDMRASQVVLVVDDSDRFGQRLRETLSASGGEVLLARTGDEGLRLAAAARPDAVVVGVGVPGSEGATLVRRIKLDAALRRTPCLLLTAASGTKDEAAVLESGADSFVRESEDPTVISAHLAALLRPPRPIDEEKAPDSLFGPQKILSVDDSPTYLQALGGEIREEGYDVVLATSGEEAMKLLRVQRVDCILLDLVMEGLSGQETCRLIKADPRLREIPLVFLSSDDDPQTKIEALNLGADDYIPKSENFAMIKARVRAQIRRKHVVDEGRGMRERILRREKEAALDAIRARDDFLAIAAHELRTPLATLTLDLETLQNQLRLGQGDNPEVAIDKAVRQTRRLAELVEGMLDVSRITTGRLKIGREAVDFSEITAEVVQRFAREANKCGSAITLNTKPSVLGMWDRLRVDQILTNLVSNAVKYGAGKPIEVTLDASDSEVKLSVRDHGIGISPADVERIFGRFERAVPNEKYGGLGLGLYITRKVVEAHGGTIDVASKPGQGSSFTVVLPRLSPSPAQAQGAS